MSVTDFAKQAVSYRETRADGGFAWNVRYDIDFISSAFEIDLRVRLDGLSPGATKDIWESGINDAWNNRAFFSDGSKLYVIKLDFDFVTSGEHQTVTVGKRGRDNMSNWYLESAAGWGPDKLDETAAHEVGHMLGNYDEYSGGATSGGFTTTKTLMSDLTLAGFENYFWGIEFYAEKYGATSLDLVIAKRGTPAGETIAGGHEMDGIYGFDGRDRISGSYGNDYINGGAGDDILDGGYDFDTLIGGAGSDTITYTFYAASSGMVVDLTAGRTTFAGDSRYDSLSSIENVVGGGGSDKLVGGSANNTLNGSLGDDSIDGKGGRDTIIGGLGADVLNGGSKADVFTFTVLSHSSGGFVDHVADFTAGTDDFDVKKKHIDAGLDKVSFSSANYEEIFSDIGKSGANELLILSVTGAARGKYLFINDGLAKADWTKDALIDITGLTGTITINDFI